VDTITSRVNQMTYKIDICLFSAQHAALGSKIKVWVAWKQYYVTERSDMSLYGLLFQ